ncbi:hypothetical protein [Gudongella sp. DL1XJH-153]|uniref:YfjL-like protein n=1 Tax=Gudongella sp. DL1XJH-153 TaxID=3409804 RepID=UPI003BB6842B
MKRNRKKVLLIVLGVITAIILSIVLYFYIALSGNPIEMWQKRSAVVNLFEDRYNQEFKVERSSYDYKRGEFDFVLYPENDPSLTFRSSLDQARYEDAYGEARSRRYIRNIITESLGADFDYLDYRMSVYEEYLAEDAFETDLVRRIQMNSYVIDFSWDVEKIDSDGIDAVFEDIANRIENALDISVGEIKIRIGVYDGVDYYHKDQIIEN